MRNFIYRILNWVALRKLIKLPGFKVLSNSAVQYRNIVVKNDCKLKIGAGSIIDCSIYFDKENSGIEIGDRVYIGGSTKLICAERIYIEDDVMVSWGCTIIDHDAHPILWNDRKNDVTDWFHGEKNWKHVISKPVTIKSKAWLGFNVIVLKGITIGEGAIIGAGSVVTKDVDPFTIVAGNPARFVKNVI